MNIADAVLLGVVQGLTEFLPVSSSGHLVLFEQFLDGFDLENALLFNVTLHLGTLLSVIVYYRRDLAGMARRVFLPPAPLAANRADSDPVPPTPPDRGYIGLIVLATFGTALIAFPLRDLVDALFGSPRAGATLLADDAARLRVVGAALIVTGLLVAVSERLQAGKTGRQSLGWVDALLIGLVQGFSVLPGISRSGATIGAALFRGVDGVQAVRFSFLLSIPAIVSAEIYALMTRAGSGTSWGAWSEFPAYAMGALSAFLVGILAIRLIVTTAQRGRLVYFAIYCWIVGGTVIILA